MALIAVLWIGLLAGLMLIGVRHGASVGLAMGHNELAAVQAHWLARAGIEQAVAVLVEDDRATDSSRDLWYDDDLTFMNVDMVSGTFSVIAPPDPDGRTRTQPRFGVTDLAGRVNVNDADRRQLEMLPDVTPSIAASILDWRDRDDNARPGGAEASYYNRLEFPYEPSNQRLQTLDELRLIQHIDRTIFEGDPQDVRRPGLASLVSVHSYELNRDAAGMERVNMNQASAQTLQAEFRFSAGLAAAVVEAQDFDNLGELLQVRAQSGRGTPQPADDEVTQITLQWLAENFDRLTLSNDERLPARINLNTAPHDVLMTLPGMTEQAADRIITFRESDAGPFYSVADLLSVGGISDSIIGQIAERVTVRSQVFRIRAIGVSPGGVRQEIVAVVDRYENPARMLYWYQSE